MQEYLGKQDWPDNEFGKRMTGGRYRYSPKFHGPRSLMYSLCMPLINADDVTKVVGVTTSYGAF